MMDALSHRGPDGEGVYLSDDVALGHKRLAIIDLVTGHQPMKSEDGRLTIVYNGEVYNYVEIRATLQQLGHEFQTTSDTEVLLHAFEEWGRDCVREFNGMWAIALWDEKSKELFLSRDRFGVKPLYFSSLDGLFLFASEPKALLASGCVGSEIREEAIYDYLVFGVTDHTRETFFRKIMQVPSGHSVVVKEGCRLEWNRYWSLENEESIQVGNEHTAEEVFKSLLEDSVRIRLRSDVPVGSCLSGGLDSTSIVCIAQRHIREESRSSNQMHTYSAIYSDPRCNEFKYIMSAANTTSVLQHFTVPTVQELIHELEDFIVSQDEPVTGLSAFAQRCVMRIVNESGVKVVLDGQGADEVLGGYTGFVIPYIADLLFTGRIGDAIKFVFQNRGNKFAPAITILMSATLVASGKKRSLLETASSTIRRVLFASAFDAMSPGFAKKWSARSFNIFPRQGSFLRGALFFATERTLQELLRYEDRNSMRYSVESRLPYLDHRLVSFANALDDSHKIGPKGSKLVLRNSMKGVIPEEIRERKDKIAFGVPQEEWMRLILAQVGTGLLQQNPRIVSYGIVSPRFIRKLLRMRYLKREWSWLAWRVLNLEIWLRCVIEHGSMNSSGDSLTSEL
jgi:asparagine synthase (glutamine-hydrolysing)